MKEIDENVKNNEKAKLTKEENNTRNSIITLSINLANICNKSTNNLNNNNLVKSAIKEKNHIKSNPNSKKIIKVKKNVKNKFRKTKFKVPESDSKLIKDKNFSSKNEINQININIGNIIIDNNHIDENKINDIEYNDYELNNLEYKEALKYDKSSFFQYYFAQIKYKNLVIFTFYTSSDYNSKILKIS